MESMPSPRLDDDGDDDNTITISSVIKQRE